MALPPSCYGLKLSVGVSQGIDSTDAISSNY